MIRERKIMKKLSQGQIIANYIEVCEILGVKATLGKGREYHIRELERYCNYEKEGHKFIITEVFDEVKPRIDNRATGGNSKYDELMDNIIINLLIENDRHIIESYTKLVNEYFDFFTPEYNKLNKLGYGRYAELNNMSKGLVMIYQDRANRIVKDCLETALNRLKRNNLISFEKKIMVNDPNFKTDFADDEMIERINLYETKVYKELDIIPFNRANPSINSKFKANVCSYLDILAYWNVYDFKLIKEMDRVEEDILDLTERFMESIHESVITRESTDRFGKVFKPYSSPKFKEDINTLEKTIWNLPANYKTEYDKENEMYDLMSELLDNDNEDIPF